MTESAPITVNLTMRSWAALSRLSNRNDDTETDALNRAIQIADHVDEVIQGGGKVLIQREPNGLFEVLTIYWSKPWKQ